MQGAQKENFEFFHTLQGCVICFNTISKEYIKKVIHNMDKAETYARIRGGLHVPSNRSLMSFGGKRQTEPLLPRISEHRPCSRKPFARSKKHIPQQKRQLTPDQEALDLQRTGKLSRRRKDINKIQCLFCSTELVTSTTFCVCDAKDTNLSKGQEEQAQTSLQEGFDHIQALPTLEMRPQILRSKIYGQTKSASTIRQSQGPLPKGR